MTIETCLGFCSLRTGAAIIGALYLIGSVAILSLSSYLLSGVYSGDLIGYRTADNWWYITYICYSISTFTITILHLIGNHARNALYVFPLLSMICTNFMVGISLFIGLLSALLAQFGNELLSIIFVVVSLVLFGINTYFLSIIYNFYQQINKLKSALSTNSTT